MVGTLSDYLAIRRREIEDALERFLPYPPAYPAIVRDAMRYSLIAGGKRLRPVLTLATAEAVVHGTPNARKHDAAAADARAFALPAACAIEYIHTYSLIHDDLPAMDNDTLRRGRPTLHIAHGEGMAILAGDGLLTHAFSVLARYPSTSSPSVQDRKVRTILRIADAAGVAGMVGGQAIDLQAAGGAIGMDADTLRGMHARKTGALIRAAASAGAIMAGGTDGFVGAIDMYAAHLGLAFQIVDDILDVEGAAEQLGKTAGKDAAAGKPTYPAIFGLDESHRLATEAIDAAKSVLQSARIEYPRLFEIADWVGSRTN
jgi:geranylgeranyl diphosphate synthase, type II